MDTTSPRYATVTSEGSDHYNYSHPSWMDTTSPRYATITSEGSDHYYSHGHPQWPESDYHSIAEDSDRTYSYPNRRYFLASSRRRESECDDTSYLSSSYATEPGATLYEEPVAIATDTSNTAPHTEYDNISSSYVIATLHEEPTDTSNTVPHSDGYKDLDRTRMEDQHGYTDISQETRGPPTVSRGGKDYHTINPTLRETHPYTLPGAVGQRVRGSNSAQSGIKSQSDERSSDCPYQGLKIDYASTHMEDQHGYSDISQETKAPPTVSRGGKDYHTINPRLRETHPYSLRISKDEKVLIWENQTHLAS